MPKARLKVKPPGGPAELSLLFPDDEYRFLSSRYGEDEVITFFEAETQNPDAVIQFIDDDPEISSYEVLHTDEHGLVIELVILGTPAPVRTALDAGVLSDDPMIVRDGWVIAEITTSQEDSRGSKTRWRLLNSRSWSSGSPNHAIRWNY